MKTQQKRDFENNASRLIEIKEQLRYLESQKSLIQDHMKAELGEGTHVIGEHVITIGSAVRSSIDTKSMALEIGLKVMEKFTRYTSYMSLNVKKASTKIAS